MRADAVGADLVRDRPVVVDDQHPAVLGVGDRDLPVLQEVGVVGLVQVPRRRPGVPRMAERPDDLPRRIRELDDGLVLLLVGDDRRAVVDEEGVIGEVEAQRIPRQARDGYRHTTCIAASINSSRLLPRSAMSSLAPKYAGGKVSGVAAAASFGSSCERRPPAAQRAALEQARSHGSPCTLPDLGCQHPLVSSRTMMQPVRLQRIPEWCSRYKRKAQRRGQLPQPSVRRAGLFSVVETLLSASFPASVKFYRRLGDHRVGGRRRPAMCLTRWPPTSASRSAWPAARSPPATPTTKRQPHWPCPQTPRCWYARTSTRTAAETRSTSPEPSGPETPPGWYSATDPSLPGQGGHAPT